jgi:hypothetical protein
MQTNVRALIAVASNGRQPTRSVQSVILLIQIFPRYTVARIPGVPTPIWMCFARVDMIRIYISCYTSRSVVTAASQVSPFREYCNHDIQANILYPVETDRYDYFRT